MVPYRGIGGISMLYEGIVCPAERFKVSPLISNNIFKPGTLGFFSHYKRCLSNAHTLAEAKVVVIRRGKSGKHRLDYNTLSFPTVFFADDTYIYNYLEKHNSHPYTVVMEPAPMQNIKLKSLGRLDFLGWALAKVMFLRNIDRNYMQYSFWPKKQTNILNIFKDSISQQGSERLEEFELMFAAPQSRLVAITAIREMESTLARAMSAYNKNVVSSMRRCLNLYVAPMHKIKKIEGYDEEKVLAVLGRRYV